MRVRKVCSLITILFKPILCPCPRNISRIQPPGRQKRGSENPSRARELYQCNVSVPLSNLEAAASPLSNSADKRCPASRKPPFRQPFPRCRFLGRGTEATVLGLPGANGVPTREFSVWLSLENWFRNGNITFILENSKRWRLCFHIWIYFNVPITIEYSSMRKNKTGSNSSFNRYAQVEKIRLKWN